MLGDLIGWLKQQDPELAVPYGFGEPSSYRGYYTDVAFEPKENTTFGEMLQHAESALGQTFCGYKGGAFKMHKYTICWIAEYGSTDSDTIGPTLKAYWVLTAKPRKDGENNEH